MKPITFMHSADYHLDDSSLIQVKPALDFILSEVRRIMPDFFVFAGDMIVKRGYLTPQVDFAVKSFFREVCKLTKVVAIPGNHDIPNSYDKLDALTGIMMASNNGLGATPIYDNFYMSSVATNIVLQSKDGEDVQFFLLPSFSKYNYLSQTEDVKPAEVYDKISEQIRNVLTGFVAARHKDMPAVLVGHGSITGGVSDTEQKMDTQIDVCIERGWIPDDFASMFGHLHKPQQVGSTVYCGSPAPHGFGEEHHDSGFEVWEYDGKWSHEHISIPSTRQLITVTIEPSAFDGVEDRETALNVIRETVERAKIDKSYARFKGVLPSEIRSMVSNQDMEDILREMGASETKVLVETLSHTQVRSDGINSSMSIENLLSEWAEVTEHSDKIPSLVQFALLIDSEIPHDQKHLVEGFSYKPIRLRAENYKQLESVDIKFEDLGNLVVITGENHSGKSNFADLEAFILWKYIRSSQLRTVRDGEEGCWAEVEFESHGDIYRVRRSVKISKNGKASADVLFNKKIGSKWEPINEGDARETQKAINNLVGSYELYRAIRYGKQSDVDALLNMTPGELKDTMQGAMNFTLFDARKETAKNKAKILTANLITVKENIESNKLVTEEEDDKKNLLNETEGDLVKINTALEQNEKIFTDTNLEIEKLDKRILESQEARDKIARLTSKENELLLDMAEEQKSETRLSKILDNQDTITAKQDELERLRKENSELGDKTNEYILLIASLNDESSARDKMVSAIDVQIKDIETDYNTRFEVWENKTKKFADDIERSEKASSLVSDVPCSDNKEYVSTCTLLKSAHNEALGLKQLITDAEDHNKSEPENREFDIGKLRTKKKGMDTELCPSQVKINDLGYDREHHDEVKKEIEEIESQNWEQLAAESVEARAELKVIGARIESMKKERDIIVADFKTLEESLPVEDEILEKIEELKSTARTLESDISTNRVNRDNLNREIGKLEEQIKRIETAKSQIIELIKQEKELSSEMQVADIYLQAVSRDGIPFLLLEKSLPMYAEAVNYFLGDAPNASAHLRIIVDPLRETQSGKIRDEVHISFEDENGIQDRQDASGLQRMLLGFSMRAGLAVIQESTGSRISDFKIDEGFGAFTANNLGYGTQVLRRIAEKFDRYIVITHVKEIVEIADTVIHIKDGVIEIDKAVA